jgi:hypothetical protein
MDAEACVYMPPSLKSQTTGNIVNEPELDPDHPSCDRTGGQEHKISLM